VPLRWRPRWVNQGPALLRANRHRAPPSRPATIPKADQCTPTLMYGNLRLLTCARQTQSVTSSVLREFRYEDGRRYHVRRFSLERPALSLIAIQPQAYLSHLYLFPNDDGEQDRLNLQHHIFRLSMDNTLHSAPIPQDKQLYILDAGCGTGIVSRMFLDAVTVVLTLVAVDY
jgi:hypothetical protein